MAKIEVTDEMVERFCNYLHTHEGCEYRAALEAALNPPPEREIYITDEMIRAGQAARDASFAVTDIYRAMRRLEPYDPLAKQGQMQSRRKNDGGGSGSGNCDR